MCVCVCVCVCVRACACACSAVSVKTSSGSKVRAYFEGSGEIVSFICFVVSAQDLKKITDQFSLNSVHTSSQDYN
jgi:hypothetical protein